MYPTAGSEPFVTLYKNNHCLKVCVGGPLLGCHPNLRPVQYIIFSTLNTNFYFLQNNNIPQVHYL